MRTVFPSHEVPHKWAHQSQPEARNAGKTIFYQGDTIYSYGHHFPMARIVTRPNGARIVLFTTRDYSVTTRRHLHATRRAIPDYLPVIDVPNVRGTWSTGRDGEEEERRLAQENLSAIVREVGEMMAKAGRARIANRPYRLAEAKQRADAALLLAERFGLPAPTFPEFTGTSAQEFARAAEAMKAEEKRQAEARRQQRAEELNKCAEAWRAGDVIYRSALSELPCMLRLASDGETVETSWGASFPARHAVRVWPMLRALRDRGESYQRNGHSLHLGEYVLDSFNAMTGELRAGCHRLQWNELENCARLLALI